VNGIEDSGVDPGELIQASLHCGYCAPVAGEHLLHVACDGGVELRRRDQVREQAAAAKHQHVDTGVGFDPVQLVDQDRQVVRLAGL